MKLEGFISVSLYLICSCSCCFVLIFDIKTLERFHNISGARTPGATTPRREDIVPSPENMDVDQENRPMIGQVVNGIVPSLEVLKNSSAFQPIKSEGQETR